MKNISDDCHVYASTDIAADLAELLEGRDARQIFLLTDDGSKEFCLPLLGRGIADSSNMINIGSGDDKKNYHTAVDIWSFLSSRGATRKAVLINLGGGMPCDLGGFCASTFKRGISFINIPTTLLSQVDASLGGKTGMNLGSLKNEIGVFAKADQVLICSEFLRSLDRENLLSGFAEMIKHGLIHDAAALERLLRFDFDNPDYALLQDLVSESILIKDFFVKADPKERGLRKALNFGHTFGHAFETYCMRHERPILHGFAVAYGMVCELMMSCEKMGLDKVESDNICSTLTNLYGNPHIDIAAIDELIELMRHDKKNDGCEINFTLLPYVGDVEVNRTATANEIRTILHRFLKLCDI